MKAMEPGRARQTADGAKTATTAQKRNRALGILLGSGPALFRSGLAQLIERADSRFSVSMEGETGPEVVRLAVEERPDVVVVQRTLPGLNGIDVIRQLRERLGSRMPPSILVVTDDRASVLSEALRAGAMGILTGDGTREEVAKAIDSVSTGRSFLSATAAEVMAAAHGPNQEEVAGSVYTILTPSERHVLQLLAEGMSTKQIGHVLSISSKTADTHRRNLMNKLKLDNVAALTRYAIREGLASLD